MAEAGTDFENHVVRLELKQVSHHRNHKRLRDRLIETNRNWPVQVSARLDLDRHKLVPRHLGHRSEDSLVQRHLANLGGHVFALITATISRTNSLPRSDGGASMRV